MTEIEMHVQEGDDGRLRVSWWEGIEKVEYVAPVGWTIDDFRKAMLGLDYVAGISIQKAGRA